jgi:hypothetical protein
VAACREEGVEPQTLDQIHEAALDDSHEAVFALLITDYLKYFLPAWCDACDRTWLAEPDDAWVLVQELTDGGLRDFGLQYGARQIMPWPDACQLMKKELYFDFDLNYAMHGHFLDRADAARFAAALRSVVRASSGAHVVEIR